MGGQQVCFCVHHHFITHYVPHHCNAITPCANLHWCLSQNNQIQQVFAAMHKIYSYVGKMSIYQVVFNLAWLLNMHQCDASCKKDCERNQKHSLKFVDFWVNSISRNSGGAPVLLIATHKDIVVSETDLQKNNVELAMSNEKIKLANTIIGNHIKSMPVYKTRQLNLKLPKQPSSLHVLFTAVILVMCLRYCMPQLSQVEPLRTSPSVGSTPSTTSPETTRIPLAQRILW